MRERWWEGNGGSEVWGRGYGGDDGDGVVGVLGPVEESEQRGDVFWGVFGVDGHDVARHVVDMF